MPTPHELAEHYLAGVATLRQAVAGMTREQLLARPVAGRWSTLEVVAHLTDFESILVDRMKRIIAMNDVPLLLVADENQFASALAYQERDLEEELGLFEYTRKQMARIIRTLKPEQLQLQGCHNKKGLVPLEKVIQMATNHVTNHLVFVAEKRRALGLA